MAKKQKRARRTSATVDGLIIDSARKLFTERGYRASTRDIAKLAGVHEPLLFRKHGTKPRLFESSLSQALIDFYDSFDRSHLVNYGDDAELATKAYQFTTELFQLISDNRQMILAYLSAREFEPELSKMPVSDALKSYFIRAENSLKRRYHLLGITPSLPPAMSARLMFLTVVAVVLFEGWIFGDTNYSHAELLAGLNRFVLSDFPQKAKRRTSAKAKATATIKPRRRPRIKQSDTLA